MYLQWNLLAENFSYLLQSITDKHQVLTSVTQSKEQGLLSSQIICNYTIRNLSERRQRHVLCRQRGLSKVSGVCLRNYNFHRRGRLESDRHHQNMTHWLHWTQHRLRQTSIRRLIFSLQLCHFTIFHSADLHSSCTNTSTFQRPLNSPLHWKASLRLSNTSANHRTSFTSCITYSGSTPGAPTRWDVSPMLLRGLEFLELRPISQVLVDPADRDPVWCLEMCRGRPWVCLVPPPPLLLLFRSIPAATPAATLYRGYSRPASPWTH